MGSVIKYIVERLAEKTTWVGLLAAISMAVSLTVEQLEAVGTLGVAMASAVLVFFKDSFLAPPKDEPPVV
jgi:hypothetical protein